MLRRRNGVDFGQYFDNNGLSLYLNRMYSKVDIYSNSIFLMTNQFLSPIAAGAPTFYQYFLADTLLVGNTKLVGLIFVPRNGTDMLFQGKMYVTLDSNYAVQRINLTVNPKINLNWVRELQIRQQFEQNTEADATSAKVIYWPILVSVKAKVGVFSGSELYPTATIKRTNHTRMRSMVANRR